VLASELLKPGAESDARTILGYLLLSELTAKGRQTSPILVELTDPDNVALFENRRAEVIVSPFIVSHMLTRVTLRRELRAVFDALFSSDGCEVRFQRLAEYGLSEIQARISNRSSSEGGYAFADLQRAADARGEIAIGVRRAGWQGMANGGVELNPRRDDRIEVHENDELIVLSTGD